MALTMPWRRPVKMMLAAMLASNPKTLAAVDLDQFGL